MPTLRLSIFLMLISIATAQQMALSSSAQLDTTEPQLPITEEEGCPARGRAIPNWKISHAAPIYSSWESNRRETGMLKPGDTVTVIGSTKVILAPDRVSVTQAIPDLGVQPGDLILRYQRLGEGTANIWAGGRWHPNYDASFTTEKNGLGCQHGCRAVVVMEGVSEYWKQVKTLNGEKGWVLDSKMTHGTPWDGGNFHDLCPEPTSD
jgi:hypothetical protein